MSLQNLIKKEHQYVDSKGGYMNLTEFDSKINSFSRATIRLLKKENGCCYMINLYNHTVQEYKSGMVYNFACQYITSNKTIAEECIEISIKTGSIFKAMNYIDSNCKDIYCLTWV